MSKEKEPEWTPIPSQKHENVDKAIKELTGIDRIKSITEKTCPFCSKTITLDSFRDELSLKEFHISGLCQGCQDKVFGTDENEFAANQQ